MYGLLVVVIILLIYFVFSSKFSDPEKAPGKVLKDRDGKLVGVSQKAYMSSLERIADKLNSTIPRVKPVPELVEALEKIANKYNIPIVPYNPKTHNTSGEKSDDGEQDDPQGKRLLMLNQTVPNSNLSDNDLTDIRYMRFLAELIINHKYKDDYLAEADFDDFFTLAKANMITAQLDTSINNDDQYKDLTRVKRIVPHKHPKTVATIYVDLSPEVELSQATRALDFSTPPAVRHLSLLEF